MTMNAPKKKNVNVVNDYLERIRQWNFLVLRQTVNLIPLSSVARSNTRSSNAQQ
jgi:hypothetical protein